MINHYPLHLQDSVRDATSDAVGDSLSGLDALRIISRAAGDSVLSVIPSLSPVYNSAGNPASYGENIASIGNLGTGASDPVQATESEQPTFRRVGNKHDYGDGYLYLDGVSGSYASIPDPLGSLGDFTMQWDGLSAEVVRPTYSVTLSAQHTSSSNAFIVLIAGDQVYLHYYLASDPATQLFIESSAIPSNTTGLRITRAGTAWTLSVDTGTGYDTHETGTMDGGALFDSTADLTIGKYDAELPLKGTINRAQIWDNGTASGDPVVDADFRAATHKLTDGDTLEATVGGTITLNGGATTYHPPLTSTYDKAAVDGYLKLDGVSGSYASIPNFQRTNLITHSEDFTNGVWTKQAGTTVTANTTETTSPTGSSDASKITSNGSNGMYNTSVGSASENTKSVYLKGVNGGEQVILKDANTVVTEKTLTLTTEWTRYSLTETQAGSFGFWLDDIPATGIYVWGAQLETGSEATEYIPTTGSAVTTNGLTDFVMEVKDVYMADWADAGIETLFAKYNAGQHAFVFSRIGANISLYALYGGAGTSAVVPHGLTGAATASVRLTRAGTSLSCELDTGLGYAAIGTTQTVPADAIDNTTSAVEIGTYTAGVSNRLTGTIGQVSLSIEGTSIFDANFAKKVSLPADVTLNGGAVHTPYEPSATIKKDIRVHAVAAVNGYTVEDTLIVAGQTLTDISFDIDLKGETGSIIVFSDSGPEYLFIASPGIYSSSILNSAPFGTCTYTVDGVAFAGTRGALYDLLAVTGSHAVTISLSVAQDLYYGGYNSAGHEISGQEISNVVVNGVEYGRTPAIAEVSETADGYLHIPGTAGNYASVPDSATLDGFGDFTFEISGAYQNNWAAAGGETLLSKWGGDASFMVRRRDSFITVNGIYGGVAAAHDYPHGLTGAQTVKVKVVRSGSSVSVYIDSGSGYAEVGVADDVGAGTVAVSTQNINIGAYSSGANDVFTGKIGQARIWSDATQTTKVLDIDFDKAPANAESFVATTGQTVTINSTGLDRARVVQNSEIFFDGTNSEMDFTLDDAFVGKMISATTQGILVADVSIAAGARELNNKGITTNATGNGSLESKGLMLLSDSTSTSALTTAFIKQGAVKSFAGRTDFDFAFHETNLTSFPSIDTSNGTSFISAFRSFKGASFPPLDYSSALNLSAAWRTSNVMTAFPLSPMNSVTSVFQAWSFCLAMVDFPANQFDTLGTPDNYMFFNAWEGCTSLSATSVDNILDSIDTSGKSAPGTGPDITIDYNVATGVPAYSTLTSLKAKGWTVTVNSVVL